MASPKQKSSEPITAYGRDVNTLYRAANKLLWAKQIATNTPAGARIIPHPSDPNLLMEFVEVERRDGTLLRISRERKASNDNPTKIDVNEPLIKLDQYLNHTRTSPIEIEVYDHDAELIHDYSVTHHTYSNGRQIDADAYDLSREWFDVGYIMPQHDVKELTEQIDALRTQVE